MSRVLAALNEATGSVLHATSLVVTDKRWAAPLSAMALGFGLFIGVAIGPNASGTSATGAPSIVEIPGSNRASEETEADEGGGGASAELTEPTGEGSGGEEFSSEVPPLSSASLAPLGGESSPPSEAPEELPENVPPESPEESEAVEATELEGVVVHSNSASGSYTLAIKGGELVPVHARKLPSPGAKLLVAARQLANGTFAEVDPPEPSGKATSASFRGVVTFLDPNPAAPAYTLSGRGTSLRIHLHPDPSGAPPQLPALGSYATVTAEIKKPIAASSAANQAAAAEAGVPQPLDPAAATQAPIGSPVASSQVLPGCVPSSPPAGVKPAVELWQRKIEIEAGEPSTYIDLAGMVTAICPDTGQLLLSADDTRLGGQDLVLTVPSKIKTAKLKLGDSFLATAEIQPDGSLALAGLAGDELIKGADDPTLAQGDLKR